MPQKVSFTNIASTVQIVDAGKSSSVDISMDIDDASKISAKGTATPAKKGWTLEDGDFNVQISKLQLASLKPLFALAGQEMDMSGELNSGITVKVDDNAVRLEADASITDFAQGVGDRRVVFKEPITVNAVVSGAGKEVQIKTAKIRSEFCNLDCSGTLESMDYAIDADLARLQPIVEQFTDMPPEVSVSGMLSARGRVEMTDGQMRMVSENSKIQQLKISVPDSEPFIQDQVTLDADVRMDMGEKTIDIRSLNLQGSRGETLINVTKGVVK